MIAAVRVVLTLVLFLIDFLVPRFITEDVALRRDSDEPGLRGYDVVCCMDDVEPWEAFDGVASASGITWLGFVVGFTLSNLRPWPPDRPREPPPDL